MSLEPLLVPASEAARLLSVGRSLFYQMHSKGTLGPMAVRFGRKTLWRVDELRAWTEHSCPGRDEWLRLKRASDE